MRLYLDACILIFLVERHTILQPMIKDAIRKRASPRLCWTYLSRLEVSVKPLRDNNMPLLDRYDRFLASPTALHVDVERKVFDLATEIRAYHGLKTPDAIHLAAAITSGCDEFWTNDQRLEKAADNRIAIVSFA